MLPNEKKIYTYRDYLAWEGEDKLEIIEGVPYLQASPGREHQRVSMNLSLLLGSYFRDRDCEVYAAPFDVLLLAPGESEEDCTNVVQPDLLVVCDQTKLNERGCKGSPDLVVEILSPSTASIDYIKKMALYEKYGVKEYWIVSPKSRTVQIFALVDAHFNEPDTFALGETVSSRLFSALAFPVKEIFR
ncbi:Uma2 family endonuclease [Carboxydocella sp. JDF658]|uniref:Uma2 family endonuclease n=1 Tax=Carboxydocella sp. JDF658 TaxID=1926600 RepID=UPI0009AE5A54|nr:Uma2 family endonuclease [Carboxydocella sp. JDF658]GAW30543.1 hypothetical protein JDF658_03080 [Carboxydocella sp. JDF658]